VVARVRRILHERRVGHTGTLDPFATGVLVILVGRATKLAQFLSGAGKEYEAVVRLGWATDSGDITGAPLIDGRTSNDSSRSSTTRVDTSVRPYLDFSDREIESALTSLRGEIDQVPPMYSAKKHQGRRLYDMARRGEVIERPTLRVRIDTFAALPRDGRLLTKSGDASCDLAVRVICSAGTYVRTLAEDLGKRLNVGAHLAALRRTAAGDFRIAQAVTLEQLQEKIENQQLTSILIPPDGALSHLPFVHLSAEDARQVRNGREVRFDENTYACWPDAQAVRMRAESGRLIAVGMFEKASLSVHPRVVIEVEK
jgi:tRNA pseudouridine55 synthase